MEATTEYTGTVYIGVSGSDLEYSQARDSIEHIARRNGDELFYHRATKGYEARQKHFNNCIDSKHDFLFLIDGDMTYASGVLERLRSHKLPYVSGRYMFRKFAPMQPIWFHPFDGRWPMHPWVGIPERNVLHPIGASGWGCILIHREVILAVRKMLKGEWEVLEDDMDIWPYDLPRIMGTLRALREIAESRPKASILYPALEYHIKVLDEEIRPLRADREQIGSDIRFPFFALQAGYQLMGDPEARCGHIVHYPLTPDDWDSQDPETMAGWAAQAAEYIEGERQRLDAQKAALL